MLATEVGMSEDVIELFKRNGAWQAKTKEEQDGFVPHMLTEHLTPEDVGKMAAMAGVKTVVMTHLGPTTDPADTYQRYVDSAKKCFPAGSSAPRT